MSKAHPPKNGFWSKAERERRHSIANAIIVKPPTRELTLQKWLDKQDLAKLEAERRRFDLGKSRYWLAGSYDNN